MWRWYGSYGGRYASYGTVSLLVMSGQRAGAVEQLIIRGENQGCLFDRPDTLLQRA
jgi:hypothetical protein